MFEEAIAIANLMLQGGQEIAQTVRTATFVDNTWKVNSYLFASSASDPSLCKWEVLMCNNMFILHCLIAPAYFSTLQLLCQVLWQVPS